MQKQALARPAAALIIATGVWFMSSCQTAPDPADSPAPTASETEEAPQQEGNTASEEQTDGATNLPDWQDGAPAAGTDAFLAWEALMGPDGEYAALASYQAVLDAFGADVEPYASIREAEARHADALIRQLDRQGIDVPENPYIGLIPAPEDLQTAAEAWAEGEVANVELYDNLIAQTEDSRLLRVFENLRRASAEQHLPAFEAAAANGGTLDASDMPFGAN